MIEAGRQSPSIGGREPAKAFLLWAIFLVPLAAWMIQLFSLYMLEDFISCAPGSRTPGVILGFGVKTIALFITGVLGSVTIAAGVLSYVLWRRMDTRSGGTLSPQRWMALAGILNSILFAMIILIKAAPPLILGVCETPL